MNPKMNKHTSIGYRTARTSLVLYVLTFLLVFITYHTLSFYSAVMAIWAAISLLVGSPHQRITAAVLLAVALALFFNERNRLALIAEKVAADRAHRIRAVREQKPLED